MTTNPPPDPALLAISQDVNDLKRILNAVERAVNGDSALRSPGLIERIEAGKLITSNLETRIDALEDRNKINDARMTLLFTVLRWFGLGSMPGALALLYLLYQAVMATHGGK